MRVFTGLTLLDTIQGTVGAVSLIPDALTPHEEAVYTNIAFMESVHAKSYSIDLLDAVLDGGDRRGVPLVGGEPEPAAQGRDRHGVLQGRRAAQAQGGLHAAGELPVLLGLLPADVLVQPGQADQHGRPDPPDHPRRGRARLLHRLQVPEGPGSWSEAERDRSSRTTPSSCSSSSTTTRCEYTQDLYDEVGLTEDVKKFLRYNANKALMNLGYEALFPRDETDVNPAILSALSPERRREPRLLLRVGLVVRHRQGRQHRGRGLGLLDPQVKDSSQAERELPDAYLDSTVAFNGPCDDTTTGTKSYLVRDYIHDHDSRTDA